MKISFSWGAVARTFGAPDEASGSTFLGRGRSRHTDVHTHCDSGGRARTRCVRPVNRGSIRGLPYQTASRPSGRREAKRCKDCGRWRWMKKWEVLQKYKLIRNLNYGRYRGIQCASISCKYSLIFRKLIAIYSYI